MNLSLMDTEPPRDRPLWLAGQGSVADITHSFSRQLRAAVRLALASGAVDQHVCVILGRQRPTKV